MKKFHSGILHNYNVQEEQKVDIDNLTEERTVKEGLLAHTLANDSSIVKTAKCLIEKVDTYIDMRVASSNSSYTDFLSRINRPVELPFAGRAGTLSQLEAFIKNGDGNIRELMCSAWLSMSHLIVEDMVGDTRINNVFEISEKLGLNVDVMMNWISEASTHHNKSCTQLSRDDLFKLDWHQTRKLQHRTRIQIIEDITPDLVWSKQSIKDFESKGGVLSKHEKELKNLNDASCLPWFDSSRMFRADENSPEIKFCRSKSIPVLTGFSGVAVQLLLFFKIANINVKDAKIAILAYLLSVGAHSFYELQISLSDALDPNDMPDLNYNYFE